MTAKINAASAAAGVLEESSNANSSANMPAVTGSVILKASALPVGYSEYFARAARRAGGRSRICLRSRKRSSSVLTPKKPASRVSVSRSGEETPRSQLETD